MNRVRKFFSTTPGLFFMALDVVLYNLALISAFYIRSMGVPDRVVFSAYSDLTTWVTGFPLVMFYFSGLYSVKWREALIPDFTRVIRAVFLATAALLAVVYLFRGQEHIRAFPASVFVITIFTGIVLVGGWRYLLRALYQHFEARSGLSRHLLIVGIEGLSAESLQRIIDNENPRFDVVGCLRCSDARREAGTDVPELGGIEDLSGVIEREKIGEVIFVAESIPYQGLFRCVQICERAGVDYRVMPTFLQMMTSHSRVDLINYVPVVRYGAPRIEGWDALFKHTFDWVVATVLLTLSLPVMIAAIIAILVDSRGFPIFVQKRVGRDGNLFHIFKFRTMRMGAQAEGDLTGDEDPRITRVGRFLRRFSIDEIPQMFNVLLGQMSMVGPRAVVPYVAERFDDMERMTLNVLPGITGLAQVSGRNELGFHGKSLLNIYYIRNYSIFLDVKILFKTFQVVFLREGTGGTKRDWSS